MNERETFQPHEVPPWNEPPREEWEQSSRGEVLKTKAASLLSRAKDVEEATIRAQHAADRERAKHGLLFRAAEVLDQPIPAAALYERKYRRDTDGNIYLEPLFWSRDTEKNIRLSDLVKEPDVKIALGEAAGFDPETETLTIDLEEGQDPDYLTLLRELIVHQVELKEKRKMNLDPDDKKIKKLIDTATALEEVKESLHARAGKIDFKVARKEFLGAEAAYTQSIKDARKVIEARMKDASEHLKTLTKTESDAEGYSLLEVLDIPEDRAGVTGHMDHWMQGMNRDLARPYTLDDHGHYHDAVTGDAVHPKPWWNVTGYPDRFDMWKSQLDLVKDERILRALGTSKGFRGYSLARHLTLGGLGIVGGALIAAAFTTRFVWRRTLEAPIHWLGQWGKSWKSNFSDLGGIFKKVTGVSLFGVENYHPHDDHGKSSWEDRGDPMPFLFFGDVGKFFSGDKDKKTGHAEKKGGHH